MRNKTVKNLRKISGRFKTFDSFEELSKYELQQMAQLNGIEILKQLRKLINTAYGMHGYNPDKLPQKHTIKIISGEYL